MDTKNKMSKRKSTKHRIKRRKDVKEITTNRVNACSICFKNIKNEYVTECEHKYCLKCICKWLENNDSCPSCRLVLTECLLPEKIIRQRKSLRRKQKFRLNHFSDDSSEESSIDFIADIEERRRRLGIRLDRSFSVCSVRNSSITSDSILRRIIADIEERRRRPGIRWDFSSEDEEWSTMTNLIPNYRIDIGILRI